MPPFHSTRIVAAVAAIGNMLQGWDGASLAGALLYIKPEFHLENQPIVYGSIVAITIVGAVMSTAVAGPGADRLGRRFMLCMSAILYSIGALFMAWSPTVYILVVGRLVVGCGIGLAVTVAPMFISEVAPAEIRGELNTFPQFAGSGGMFLAYCMVFGLSLTKDVPWRLMLSILFIPSVVFLVFGIFYLPESPRWLVSKGRMLEAKKVLQQLRNREDVAGEMALLVEGLDVGANTTLEEYIIEPTHGEKLVDQEGDQITLFGPEEGLTYVAKPVSSYTSSHGFLSRHASVEVQSAPRIGSNPLMDPVVTLFGSLQTSTLEQLPEVGTVMYDHPDAGKFMQWDEENTMGGARRREYNSDDEMVGPMEDDLRSPLLSRPQSEIPSPLLRADSTYSSNSRVENSRDAKDIVPSMSRSNLWPPQGSYGVAGGGGESYGSMGIGGGWQLAWQYSASGSAPPAHEGKQKPEEGSFKRMYLLQEGGAGEQSRFGSAMSLPPIPSIVGGEVEHIQAAVLISRPASKYGKELLQKEHPVGPAMVHPAEVAAKRPAWSELFEGGVKRALMVGISLQVLEQFAGINAVLYFTPQILQESGAQVLLANAGISNDSASLLASAVTSLLMLPAIILAMQLMDKKGRRQILLYTIPVLIFSLVALVMINIIPSNAKLFAIVSVFSVVLYICFFVMGFGPIPNIICAEIFPTRVRGTCTAICQGVMWLCDIIVTELFPILDQSVGIAGAFGFFAVVCAISWVFVFLKVPETRGMPLEVIAEFFALSANKEKEVKAAIQAIQRDSESEQKYQDV